MKFRTEINIPQSAFDINHQMHIMSLGSCFSEHIGKKLTDNKFKIVANPFGILYNPSSIHLGLRRILSSKPFGSNELIEHNNLFKSFMHHGSFSSIEKNRALKKINDSFFNAHSFIQKTDVLLISFGTAYIFKHKATGNVVANCHKLPPETFTRQRLTVKEITNEWTDLIKSIKTLNPNIKIIITVSPVRHWKDGAHENQISKSILHLSIENLISKFGNNVFYFPAYELLIDDLRDYRFYDSDMMHPSNIAIEYIWQKFGDTYFDNYTKTIIKEWQHIFRSLNHIPFNVEDNNFILFRSNTLEKLITLQNKYSHIDFSQEIEFLSEK